MTAAVAHELDAALARTAPDLTLPTALRRVLATAVATFRAEGAHDRAAQFVRHYTEVMPRERARQLAPAEPASAGFFHVPLAWERLPRLGRALDRLFALLGDAGVDATPALGAPTADAFCARTPTLAALYTRTHYGGFMPLLYGASQDLAFFARRGAERGLDRMATIDRYLTAPIVHELCHFSPTRDAFVPLHLDECIAGWLGVSVHPEFSVPAIAADGTSEDDALYAAPWLAQVGQAIARAFGLTAVVRAHAGVEPWTTALPAAFVDAAVRVGEADWAERRSLHFLADPHDPAPWLALVEATGPLPDDPGFDRTIVADGIAAMCLAHERIDGAVRTRAAVPASPIVIDACAGRITTARRSDADLAVPSYWLPPPVAAGLRARGLERLDLRLADLADIDDVAGAVCEYAR